MIHADKLAGLGGRILGDAAAAIAAAPRVLRCYRCGALMELTAEDIRDYLAAGWPRCCGQTMTMETAQ